MKKVRGVQGKFKGGRNIFYSAIGGQPSRVIPLKTDLDQRRLAGRWGQTLNKNLFLNLFFSNLNPKNKSKTAGRSMGPNPEPGLVSKLQPDDLPVGLFSFRLATKAG